MLNRLEGAVAGSRIITGLTDRDLAPRPGEPGGFTTHAVARTARLQPAAVFAPAAVDVQAPNADGVMIRAPRAAAIPQPRRR